jgi:hypothetical protein
MGTIPVTLYHPAFGRFQEDYENYTPTKEDNEFAMKFSLKMSEFYEKEDARAADARSIFEEYGLTFNASRHGGYTSDGDIRVGECFPAILEVKLELGSGGADPLLQAACYYHTFMVDQHESRTNLPCFIIYLAGEFHDTLNWGR